MAKPDFDPSTVRAILFDLDGTLYRQSQLRRMMLLRLLRGHVLHPLRGARTFRALEAYRRAQEHLRERLEPCDLAQEQIRVACETSGATTEFLTDCVERWMDRSPLDLLARNIRVGLVEFLDWAKRNEMPMSVLSDYPAQAKLEALGVAHYFDLALSAQSPEIGTFKPSPRGLVVLAERLGVPPEECLYIGDRPEVDGAAAQAAGMPCVIVDSTFGFVELLAVFTAARPELVAAQPSLHRR
jgi:HAD superfamily hydrolase (TIGR01549 family)